MAKARYYEMNELAAMEVEFKGQAALIYKSLLDNHPQTAKSISDNIKAKLTTRQDPLRVVSFYLSTWKKSGLVNVVDEPGNEPATHDEPVTSDISEVTPTHEFEDDSVAADESAPDFDYANSTLSEAVFQIVDIDGASTPQEISDRLQIFGRTANAKSVADTARKLVSKGKLVKVEDGKYDLSA